MSKIEIAFCPKIGDRVSFASDRQFEKGPFDGGVLRINNGICEIGHKGCQDEWGFVVSENMRVKSMTLRDDGYRTWNLY